ncbi:DUF6085 family protein [Streptomyces spinosisporus]|uniref:DUF6085 family protein n=1 Tax=Streptomyces spinosisporus TaxID=2927582 RepID=A0ABS9XW96_9ACTN|nr:DUF6085 family protein [Streptomyces spinosisporus]MCI3246350.1 DUF6085 family protein [Streptomyces spinosisporus]
MTDLPASTAPAAAGNPLVKGRCPACRGASLFLGNGGYVTCSRLDCPNPSAADDLLHGEAPGPAATEATGATDRETTTRVFAALHQSAERDVSCVITLYERWVKAGPPPLGTLMSRWWDQRLAELHAAILPSADQAKGKP